MTYDLPASMLTLGSRIMRIRLARISLVPIGGVVRSQAWSRVMDYTAEQSRWGEWCLR